MLDHLTADMFDLRFFLILIRPHMTTYLFPLLLNFLLFNSIDEAYFVLWLTESPLCHLIGAILVIA